MTRLSDLAIAQAAVSGGFPTAQVGTAVAVALAESGGETTATNHNSNGTTDHGLWQINDVNSSALALGDWTDPATNARMAKMVYDSQGWHAWTTYNTGAYLLYAARGKAAASRVGPNDKGYLAHRVRATEWRSYSGKVIPAPPVGTYKAAPLQTAKSQETPPTPGSVDHTVTGWVPVQFPASKDAVVWAWIVKYTDGKPSLSGKSYTTRPDHQTVYNLYYQILHDYRHATTEPKGGGAFADPGQANAGVGPLSDFLGPLQALADFVKFITDPHNWLRVAMFVGGGALVIMAAMKLSGANVGGAVKTAAEVAAL